MSKCIFTDLFSYTTPQSETRIESQHLFFFRNPNLMPLSLLHADSDICSWQAVIMRLVVGIGLALLLLLPNNDNVIIRYFLSPWILPTVMISFGLVLVFDNVCLYLIAPRGLENKGPYAAPRVRNDAYQLTEVGKGNVKYATMQTYPVRGS